MTSRRRPPSRSPGLELAQRPAQQRFGGVGVAALDRQEGEVVAGPGHAPGVAHVRTWSVRPCTARRPRQVTALPGRRGRGRPAPRWPGVRRAPRRRNGRAGPPRPSPEAVRRDAGRRRAAARASVAAVVVGGGDEPSSGTSPRPGGHGGSRTRPSAAASQTTPRPRPRPGHAPGRPPGRRWKAASCGQVSVSAVVPTVASQSRARSGEPRGVAVPGGRPRRVLELFGGVLAEAHQHREPGVAVRSCRPGGPGLVQQRLDHVQEVGLGADRRRHSEVPLPREDRQPSEGRAVALGEQVVAPGDGRPQVAMPVGASRGPLVSTLIRWPSRNAVRSV